MQKSNQKLSKNMDHKKSTKKSPLVEVERIFRASPQDLFQYLSDENLVKEWWGPEGFTSPVAKIDFREGGVILSSMRNELTGEEFWSKGTILEIVPDQKILMSEEPSNERGENLHGENAIRGEKTKGPFADVGLAYVTFELDPLTDDTTLLKLSHEGLPARMHDDCVQGWASSFNKLARAVEKH